MEDSIIIIDNGSGSQRFGFARERKPGFVTPTGNTVSDEKALFNNPVERGRVKNWDDLEALWDHAFKNGLKTSPKNMKFIVTELVNPDKKEREKTAELLFEKFGASAIYTARSLVLSTYACGQLNGLVVQSGAGVTQVAPVLDGFAVEKASVCLEWGGNDLDAYLQKLLQARKIDLPKENAAAIACSIKEKLCYAALDFDAEAKKELNKKAPTFELPDGSKISIDHDCIQVPEAMFNPKLLGVDSPGLGKLLADSVSKCDAKRANELFSRVLAAGGNTSFKNFDERLLKEVAAFAPKNTSVKLMPCYSSKIDLSWIGGSILSMNDNFQAMWFGKKEYNEKGASAVNAKCV